MLDREEVFIRLTMEADMFIYTVKSGEKLLRCASVVVQDPAEEVSEDIYYGGSQVMD
jgi:hypothetical protein